MVSALQVQNSFPYGREPELTATRALLDAAEAGRGAALVLAAGVGEGRTTLLHAAAALAGPRWRILEATGHPGLRLAGLQHLIAPLAPLAGDLPAHQREPVTRVIAGEEPGCSPLVLGVSVLALLRRAAHHGPILLLADDADRLDPESWQQINLIAQRLSALPVVLLATSSPGFAAGLPLRVLPPLDETASHHLLTRHAPDLAPEVAAALVDLAAGHPGALTDLAAALTPEQRRGYAPPPTGLPAESPLRRHAHAALRELPPMTRRLLLLAAAELNATPAELLAAAHLSSVRSELAAADPSAAEPNAAQAALADLEPAERAGMIEVSASGVRFTPPVLRSVVYGEAPIGQRHAAHRALAGVLGRRLPALLHRAAVVSGTDDDLARDLLEAATNAPAAEAFAARRRAAELRSDPAAAAEASLAAARSALAAGRSRDASALLRRAVGHAVVRDRARALIAGMHARGAPAESRDTLLDVAGELMTTDPAGALEALLVAGEACGRTGNAGLFPELARQAAARCRDGRVVSDMAVHQVLGLADLMTGAEESGFGHLREVVRLAAHTGEAAPLIRAANAGILLGDDHRAAGLADRAATSARETGNAPLVPEALEVAAYAELAAGRHDAALENALDGAAISRGAGRPDLAEAHLALIGLLAAFRGFRDETKHAGGLGEWSEALLDLAAGEPGKAAERLIRVAGTGPMTLRVAVAPHLVEATGAGGEVFDRWAGRTGQPAWLALRSRCRALTTPEGADDYFREALTWHDRDEGGGLARAHTELLYGRHLRRRRRPAEARAHLRRAVERFHLFDAGPWADQAAGELRAAGERIGPIGRAPLTAQQERIAGLVAEGATNREVARQLHLSPRTIDHHLRNVFARLGVRSRTELARLLAT